MFEILGLIHYIALTKLNWNINPNWNLQSVSDHICAFYREKYLRLHLYTTEFWSCRCRNAQLGIDKSRLPVRHLSGSKRLLKRIQSRGLHSYQTEQSGLTGWNWTSWSLLEPNDERVIVSTVWIIEWLDMSFLKCYDGEVLQI